MSIKSNFPAISPSLLLDFSNTKKLDPRITFTRSSTAIYFDNNGILQTSLSGIPRFDHNPITGESLGLLIEEQRTNLLTYSQVLGTAPWGAYGVATVGGTTLAPDGNNTGQLFTIPTSGNGWSGPVAIVSASTAYTNSFYVKASIGTQIRLFMRYYNAGVSTGNSATTFTIAAGQAVGNGWYRITFTETTPVLTNQSQMTFLATASGDAWYLWGAQLEAGAFATSYIPTVASQVTRSADAASMTGTNFSSWFNASEGTMFAEATRIGTAANRAFSVGAGSNYMYVIGTESVVVSSGSTQVNLANTLAADSTYKTAMAYAINNFATVVNGGTVQTDNLGTVPSGIVSAGIGQITTGSTFAGNGAIKRIAYYPRRLSNSELQAITG